MTPWGGCRGKDSDRWGGSVGGVWRKLTGCFGGGGWRGGASMVKVKASLFLPASPPSGAQINLNPPLPLSSLPLPLQVAQLNLNLLLARYLRKMVKQRHEEDEVLSRDEEDEERRQQRGGAGGAGGGAQAFMQVRG